jgi:glycosyltransferase involved in cell wall biosynthesis
MKEIVFLGGIFPDDIREDIEIKSSGVIQNAADSLQKALISGLKIHFEKVNLINLPFIGSFPKRYKDFFTDTFEFSFSNNSKDINVGFNNLSGYKYFSRYFNAKKYLRKRIKPNNQVIIIYSVHLPFIKAAIDFKIDNPNIKVCLVVPDLPQFMGYASDTFFGRLKQIEQNYLAKYLAQIDAFVLLTDSMAEPLLVGNRPMVRIEGMFDFKNEIKSSPKEKLKTILYSGTLATHYGLINLLNAFILIKDKDFRLWICGEGDAKDEILNYSKLDNRIEYLGQLKREEVLKLQSRATLLVNPRTSEGEFTKFSFPSKIMEYFASGTPCLMYKLAGIPDEYFNYCFMIEGNSILELSKSLELNCNRDETELKSIGESAKKFILNHKNSSIQTKKIFDMLIDL